VQERLSDRARRVLELAEGEARGLGHGHVGTEHLLLGVLAEGESGAARALVAAGARLDGARGKVAEAVGRDGRARRADEPLLYTARAGRALERASRLSLQRREEQVGTSHLLVSVLDVEGTAGQVLRGLGVDVVALRDTVAAGLDPARLAAQGPPAAGATPAPGPAATGAGGPRCPACRAPVDATLAYRTLEAAGDPAPRRVAVVYCTACGSTLGVTAC
jgi:ATP-dependent Clp protease ATP-binding subunit ClpC